MLNGVNRFKQCQIFIIHYNEPGAKPIIEDAKKPQQAAVSEPEPEKGKYQRAQKPAAPDDEEARKLKMGKGVIPDKKDDGENVKLKPIPEKQAAEKVELKPAEAKKATTEGPKDKPKAKKATKSKYEDLPEIPDYERPELEKYEESDFNPSKKVKQKNDVEKVKYTISQFINLPNPLRKDEEFT
ncbi:CLUMA_CG012837, isoform A [Clunio marinus]|uniref:CLUMA_CG012837, isoform A n=1 Tax=Clunio marinus TaxID=568069 RepID=A0A1J1IKB3_9DIPT|nr:CLUMA_CG012837, isoform A [Clunio marinus]